MTAFDPIEAAKTYAKLDKEELIRIAYLEPDYLSDAKTLAARELDRRGVPENRGELIDQTRAELERQREIAEMQPYENMAKADAVNDKISNVFLVSVLWMLALFVPVEDTIWKELWTDWVRILFLVVWAAVVFKAIRKARNGARREMYLVLVVPVVLMVAGVTYRMLT